MKNKIIDLSDFDKWPSQLVMLYENEDKEGILNYFNDKILNAWHCTKLIAPESVQKRGLRISSPKMYEEEIVPTLKQHLTTKDFQEFSKVYQAFKDEGGYDSRDQTLWFLLNKKMAVDEFGGCEDFFKYYGGEVTKRIVEYDLPHLMEKTETLGNPFLVEFEVSFDELPEYRKTIIGQSFIDWKKRKEKWEPNSIFESEAYVSFDIPGERIIDIIPFEINRPGNN